MNNSHCVYCNKALSDDQRVNALFSPDHCRICESIFKRKELKKIKSTEEKQHDSDYRKFLQGKLYPEIKVSHSTADGKCSTSMRLQPSTKFFELED